MPMPFRKKPSLRPEGRGREPRKYIDLSEMDSNVNAAGATQMYVKFAEINKFEDIGFFSQIVDDGDVLILDYGAMQGDELQLKRIMSELKRSASETNGDVVSFGGKYIIVTPRGVKIQREKIKPPEI